MEKAEYVDRIAIRAKVCTGCTMLVDGVCRDADPCEKLIAGFLEEPSADVIPAHRKEKAHNDPLTLDELRKMEGQPVWMHTFSAVQKKTNVAQWAILETVGSANATFLRAGVNSRPTKWFCNYGERWLAYRQKPEEGTV